VGYEYHPMVSYSLYVFVLISFVKLSITLIFVLYTNCWNIQQYEEGGESVLYIFLLPLENYVVNQFYHLSIKTNLSKIVHMPLKFYMESQLGENHKKL
jgi:hypothetical protein